MALGGGGFAEVACLGGVRPSTMLDSRSTILARGWIRLSSAWNIIFIMLSSVSSNRWLDDGCVTGCDESSTISFPGACMDEPRDRAGMEEIMEACSTVEA